MASEQLQIDIIAPTGALFQGDGDMVIIPGDDGDLGILAGHIATIAALRAGVLWIYHGGKLTKKFFISGGFADIGDKKVAVLANSADNVDDLQSKDIEKHISQLSEELKHNKDESQQTIIEQKLQVARAALASLSEKMYS
ncbi:MAG: ATP synthase F1 subunit epsilon [Alphaproteobacteria bacterium]